MIFCMSLIDDDKHHVATDNGSFVVANRLGRLRFSQPLADRFDHLLQLCNERRNKRQKEYHTYVLVCPD